MNMTSFHISHDAFIIIYYYYIQFGAVLLFVCCHSKWSAAFLKIMVRCTRLNHLTIVWAPQQTFLFAVQLYSPAVI